MASRKTASSRSNKEKATASAVSKKGITSRKTSRSTSTTSLSHAVNVAPVSSATRTQQAEIRRPYMIAIIAAVAALLLLYVFRNVFVAAVVNGQPISRLSVVNILEQQGGKQALQTLITNTLIQQEANKRHIAVNSSDVDSEIKLIEGNLAKQGQTLDAALQTQGMTRQNLNDQIKIQKLVEKMVGPISVSDQEVSAYMDKNKDSLQPGATAVTIKRQLQQQKLQQKEQAFVDNLVSKAKISYWKNY